MTTLSDRIDSILIERSRGRDGRVVIDPVSAVDGPVVVAVVMDVTVAAVHEAVGARLLGQGAVRALY